MKSSLPLLFACSGCSNAGHLADQLARELDRRGIAEMSCLAGVGASKQHFLKKLREREVWIIDGCPIECSLGIFSRVQEYVDVHIRLHDLGVKKHAPLPDAEQFEALVEAARQAASQQLLARAEAQARATGA